MGAPILPQLESKIVAPHGSPDLLASALPSSNGPLPHKENPLALLNGSLDALDVENSSVGDSLPSNGSIEVETEDELAASDTTEDGASHDGVAEEAVLVKAEERILEEDEDQTSAPEGLDGAGKQEPASHPGTCNGDEAGGACLDDVGGESSHVLPPDEIAVGLDESGWTNVAGRAAEKDDAACANSVEGVDSAWTNGSGEGDASDWIAVDAQVPLCAPKSLDERVVPLFRRRTFYLIRMPKSVDNTLRNKNTLADLHYDETTKKRDFLKAALQLKMASKLELRDKLDVARVKEKPFDDAILRKRKEIDSLQSVLAKLKVAHNTTREDQELHDRIAYLQHRIQHESIPLKEEKQLVREIKQLESTRSQVSANVVAQAELIENLGPREDIEDQRKMLYLELDILKSELNEAVAESEPIRKEYYALNETMKELRQQFEKAERAQQEAYVARKELRQQQFGQNNDFYKNKEDIRKAKVLGSQKSLEALEALCHEQVESIFARWTNDASFRADYIKNNEQSTLRRLETLDGRSLGPDEDPPLLMSDRDAFTDSLPKSHETVPEVGLQTMTALGGGHTKVLKAPIEEAKLPAKVVKATPPQSSAKANAVSDLKNTEVKVAEPSKLSKPSTSGITADKPKLAPSLEDIAKKEAEAAELKDKRRQEEMAKAREAAERKKRQAERVQAKALLRAQKEAERREKEREKKARKKAAANAVKLDPADVASQSETRDVAAAPEELLISDTSKEIPEAVKGASSQRRKPPGRKSTVARRAIIDPLSRKGMWPPPIWVWALLAVIVLIVLLALMMSF